MAMQDQKNNIVKKDDDSTTLSEDELHYFEVELQCEECDYRWRSKEKAYLSDEDRTGSDRWIVDDSTLLCPICGSQSITRV